MKIQDEKCRNCGCNPVYLRTVVNRLVKAELANSWKGGGDPADVPIIERELRDARSSWQAALEEISA